MPAVHHGGHRYTWTRTKEHDTMTDVVDRAFDHVIRAATAYKDHPTADTRVILDRRLDDYQAFWIYSAAERNTAP